MSRAGSTGINTPAQVMGYNSSTSALVARWSIDVCDDRRMMRDSANANYILKSESALAAMAEGPSPQSRPQCSGSIMLGTRRTNQSVERQLGVSIEQS